MLRQFSINRLEGRTQKHSEYFPIKDLKKVSSTKIKDTDFFLLKRSKTDHRLAENIQISFNPFQKEKESLVSSKNSNTDQILLLTQSFQNRNCQQSLTKYIYNPKKEKNTEQTILQNFLEQSNLCQNCAKNLMENGDLFEKMNQEKIILSTKSISLQKQIGIMKEKLAKYQEEIKYQDTIIKEKGQIIMKMSNFNDQLCHKLIDMQSYLAIHQNLFNASEEKVYNMIKNNSSQQVKPIKQSILEDSSIMDYIQIVKRYSQFIECNRQEIDSHIQESSLDISLTNKFKNLKPCQQFLQLIESMENKNIGLQKGKIQNIF